MSNEHSPTACLMVLRNALIERRRQIAKTAWDSQQGDRLIGMAVDLGVKLKSLQDAIEAVDRAITDEEIVKAAESNSGVA